MSFIHLLRKTLLAVAMVALPAASYAQFSIGISINVEPPALPVYVQPPCPQPNFMWTPGYWAWDPDSSGYFWVPGTWVEAPTPGYLWTPGYWGWGDGGVYVFHGGYWGEHVGFYGGVNYGFGFGGVGFGGGEWRGGVFAYNTAVVSVNTTIIHNTYINKTVINNTTIINNHTSFNGGPNGVAAKPTAQEQSYASERHIQPTAAQTQHAQVAKQDKSKFASVNHGAPAHAATAKPVTSVAELQHSAVPAKMAPGAKPYVAPAKGAPAKPAPASKLAPEERATPKPASKPAPMERATPKPAPKPAPMERATPKPAPKPAPEERAAPKPAPKPAPMERAAPKPAPAAKPAPHPAPKPKPEEKKPQ
jgi:hypothetical protein